MVFAKTHSPSCCTKSPDERWTWWPFCSFSGGSATVCRWGLLLAFLNLLGSDLWPVVNRPRWRPRLATPNEAVLTSVLNGHLAFSAPRCHLLVVVGDLNRVVKMTNLDRPVTGHIYLSLSLSNSL